MSDLLGRIDRLNSIGIALSAESDIQKLLELIMLGAKGLTRADAGTLYILKDDTLSFEIISNDTLNLQMGGTSGNEITFPPIPVSTDGIDNHSMVVSHSVLTSNTINISDAYNEAGFDFSGTRKFDAKTGYRTQSILTIPLKDHENETIGVLQLINAIEAGTGKVIAFSSVDQQLAESLASQAAVSLTQRRLLNELQELFEAFIKLIANAIDDKSPYTGGHCRRIPVLTMMLANATHNTKDGPMADFSINDKDRYELETAAWLHDCGKVVTPEYVMDKSTKLETILDRIQLIEARFEILLRELKINYLEQSAECTDSNQRADLCSEYEKECERLIDDLEFLKKSNIGGEFLTDEHAARIEQIAKTQWQDRFGQAQNLISEDELVNLKIKRGTLNDTERDSINYHIVATINMLESLPFPKHLENVPEYAGGHHEKMDGTGYPKGLKRDEMSIQARIMAIADIFEALTASDRPYKKGKKLSECLRIMGFMKKDNHIDADLFDIFVREKVYQSYADEFLDPEQIDEFDLESVLGTAH